MAWWRNYFDETFFQLHEDLFPEEESRREVAAILDLLGLPTGARVLDLPCGWGRHTLLLPEAGQDAFGAELSVDLLRRADAAAADVRELPFRDGSFDAVLNIFTSLGLFLDDREDIRALAEARRVLRPGGQFLLESMHRDDVVCTYAERDRWNLPTGIEVRVRRRFNPVTGISEEKLRWRRGEEQGEKSHALKLRTATEIDGLLRAAGFEEIRYYGDWTGEPLRHDSPRVIAIATAN
jgi:ubiquinone/menaquinone biosynthesis C-methylase UbiE